MPLLRVPVQHGIAYITAVTEAEYESEFEPTKDNSYLTCKLWDVFCEDLGEILPHYNGTSLYSNGKHLPKAIALVTKTTYFMQKLTLAWKKQVSSVTKNA